VEWFSVSPDADPFLCVFANTLEDVTLIDSLLNLKGKEVRSLLQREAVDSHPVLREMERLNARFMGIHTIQREPVQINGKTDIAVYFLVQIVEQTGGRYYLMADNKY
jgi:hypothetical protein